MLFTIVYLFSLFLAFRLGWAYGYDASTDERDGKSDDLSPWN